MKKPVALKRVKRLKYDGALPGGYKERMDRSVLAIMPEVAKVMEICGEFCCVEIELFGEDCKVTIEKLHSPLRLPSSPTPYPSPIPIPTPVGLKRPFRDP